MNGKYYSYDSWLKLLCGRLVLLSTRRSAPRGRLVPELMAWQGAERLVTPARWRAGHRASSAQRCATLPFQLPECTRMEPGIRRSLRPFCAYSTRNYFGSTSGNYKVTPGHVSNDHTKMYMYIYIYIYIYTHVCVCTYIYIYITTILVLNS